MIDWYLTGSCIFAGVFGFVAGTISATQRCNEKHKNEITARICELYRKDKIMTETRYPVYHKNGCGEIGMHTTVENPEVNSQLAASDFFKLDGSEIIIGEPCVCGYCNKYMLNQTLGRLPIDWIDYDNPVKVEDNGS